MENYTGFHGTGLVNAGKILADGFHRDKKSNQLPGDLGRGVYSFLNRPGKNDGKENALNYMKNVKTNYQNPVVIKLNCLVNEDDVLDMDDSENIELFTDFREKSIQLIEEEKAKLICDGSLKRGNLDGLVLELLLDLYQGNPKAVKKMTFTRFDSVMDKYKTSNFPNGLEFCIRDKTIIHEKSIVD